MGCKELYSLTELRICDGNLLIRKAEYKNYNEEYFNGNRIAVITKIVTRDIPSNAVAYGNPCRVIKNI